MLYIIHLDNDILHLYHPVLQPWDEDEGVDDGPHDGPDDNPKTKESENLTDKHDWGNYLLNVCTEYALSVCSSSLSHFHKDYIHIPATQVIYS